MNSWIVFTIVLIPIAVIMKGSEDNSNYPTEDKVAKQLRKLNKSIDGMNRRR